MNVSKMRNQLARSRTRVSPAELAQHPTEPAAWSVHVVMVDAGFGVVVCDHCDEVAPCPTALHVHQRSPEHEWCRRFRSCRVGVQAARARQVRGLP